MSVGHVVSHFLNCFFVKSFTDWNNALKSRQSNKTELFVSMNTIERSQIHVTRYIFGDNIFDRENSDSWKILEISTN